jgi:hypothetical protein
MLTQCVHNAHHETWLEVVNDLKKEFVALQKPTALLSVAVEAAAE